MEFVPAKILHNLDNCVVCSSPIEVTIRYHNRSGCFLCERKPIDQCYCEYYRQTILYSCPICRCVCQRCGCPKEFYFNERKHRGSGRTRHWIAAYNDNKPFTRLVSGLSLDFRNEYYPQDLCDSCIDILLGWAWRNIKPFDPYLSKQVYRHPQPNVVSKFTSKIPSKIP